MVVELFLPAWLFAGEARWEDPWLKKLPSQTAERPEGNENPSLGQKAAEGVIRFFQEYISPVDGDRCPCYPTCAQYSAEAVRKHGLLVGLVMTFDRLIHESDEMRMSPLVKVYESYRYYDPVENNDFWWEKNSNQPSAKTESF